MAAVLPTHATDLYWNASGSGTGTGGTGTWNTSSAFWKTTSGGSSYQVWPTTDPSTSVARFAAASTLTLANSTTIYANGLNFGATTSLISGDALSKIVINGTSPTLTLSTATVNLNTTVELVGSTSFTSSSSSNILGIGRSTTNSAASGSLTTAGGINPLFTSSSRAGLAVGQTSGANTLGSSTGTVDFSGSQVNAYLSTLRVGQLSVISGGGLSSANVTGTFDFGSNSASTIDILASLPVGVGLSNLTSNTHAGSVSGTLNTQAGTHTYTSTQNVTPVVKIGEFTSNVNNGTNLSTVSGTWNISGGTTNLTPLAGYDASTYVSILLANRSAILNPTSTVTGTLNLTGGTLNVVGGHIAGGGGTSTFTLNGGTLNLNGGSLGLSTGLITNLNFQSGTLTNIGEINNGAGLTKTTGGILRLTGTQTYTGGTVVSGGTLLINANLTNSSSIQLAANTTLGGTGSANGMVTTVAATSALSAGDSSANTFTLNGGLNASAGATFYYDLGTTSDLISLGSTDFTNPGLLTFNFANSGGITAGFAYTLLTFGSSTGFDYSDLVTGSLVSGYVLDTSFGTNGYLINGTSLQVQFVPEPSSWLLLALGAVFHRYFRRVRA